MTHLRNPSGRVWACEHPEGDGWNYDYPADDCRACLVALIGLAANKGNELGDSDVHGEIGAADACLVVLRAQYDEFHPLRVVAERVLVPLVAT